jgi:hypothetical protein
MAPTKDAQKLRRAAETKGKAEAEVKPSVGEEEDPYEEVAVKEEARETEERRGQHAQAPGASSEGSRELVVRLSAECFAGRVGAWFPAGGAAARKRRVSEDSDGRRGGGGGGGGGGGEGA